MADYRTSQAAQSLKQKLVAFTLSLDPEEQEIFLRGLASVTVDDDVQGYDLDAFVARLIADWNRIMHDGDNSAFDVPGQGGAANTGIV